MTPSYIQWTHYIHAKAGPVFCSCCTFGCGLGTFPVWVLMKIFNQEWTTDIWAKSITDPIKSIMYTIHLDDLLCAAFSIVYFFGLGPSILSYIEGLFMKVKIDILLIFFIGKMFSTVLPVSKGAQGNPHILFLI